MVESSASDVDIDSDWERAIASGSNSVATIHVCPHEGCSRQFAKVSRLKTHILSHTGARPFTCDFEGCGAAFKRLAHVRRHKENKHRSDVAEVQCPKCPRKYASRDALLFHDRKCHSADGSRFPCGECGASFHKKNFLASHVAKEHQGVLPHECSICSKRFLFPNKLREHMQVHERRCATCGLQVASWSEMRLHMAAAHPKPRECEHCKQQFATRSQLKQHKKIHSETRQVFCCTEKDCDKKFLYLRNLRVHVRMVHSNAEITCTAEGCDAKLSSRRKLAAHLRQHSSDGGGAAKTRKKPCARVDKGLPKKPVACLLTGLEVDSRASQALLSAAEGIRQDVAQIAEELQTVPSILNTLPESDEEVEEEGGPQMLCRRRNNVKKTGIDGFHIIKSIRQT